MDFKRFLSFAAKVTIAHVVSYLVVGAAAYQLLTKQFYEGSNPVFSTFMTPVVRQQYTLGNEGVT